MTLRVPPRGELADLGIGLWAADPIAYPGEFVTSNLTRADLPRDRTLSRGTLFRKVLPTHRTRTRPASTPPQNLGELPVRRASTRTLERIRN